jgi:uncharacterized protein (DUF1684 family)
MRTVITILFFACCALHAPAQSYNDSIAAFRKTYIKELLEDKRAPVKPAQVSGISFFRPDPAYRVWAAYTETPGTVPFMIQTHSGKKKPYRQCGLLTFSIHDTTLTLQVYQSIDLMQDEAHKDDIFVPFNDMTNYETSYAGGRYIDLSLKDIKDGKIMFDFNRSYNPYCAYADGYSCPIPPDENRLQIEIPAGEKMFQQ